MFDSLRRNAPGCHLYVFAFDDLTHQVLKDLQHEALTVIPLSEFETPQLQAVKPGRSRAEYCWTCTPAILLHCLNAYKLPACTYVDADLYFSHDPRCLIGELKGRSVLLTEHRYTSRYDHSKTSGIYCVQFMTFRNTPDGLAALRWWADRCLEWCYNRLEDGKFGDQMYLNDWPSRFNGVHVLQHEGGGLAPWNIQQYKVIQTDPWQVINLKTGCRWPVVFYHFHSLRFLANQEVDFGAYSLPKDVLPLYRAYVAEIDLQEQALQQLGIERSIQPYRTSRGLHPSFHKFVRRLTGTYNVYHRSTLKQHAPAN
jgi:hypothetical protein